jgi:hypothetical protein
MKQLFIVFAVLLVSLTLISAVGGGIRPKVEGFYYEEEEDVEEPSVPPSEEEGAATMMDDSTSAPMMENVEMMAEQGDETLEGFQGCAYAGCNF